MIETKFQVCSGVQGLDSEQNKYTQTKAGETKFIERKTIGETTVPTNNEKNAH
jgi:hypothetical protein